MNSVARSISKQLRFETAIADCTGHYGKGEHAYHVVRSVLRDLDAWTDDTELWLIAEGILWSNFPVYTDGEGQYGYIHFDRRTDLRHPDGMFTFYFYRG